MHIADLLAFIPSLPGCTIYPPAGLPVIASPYVLPDDVAWFYRHCGGAQLFAHTPYATLIVPPDKVVPANPVILVGVSATELAQTAADPSWSWHIIAEGPNAQYITIDLDPSRLGRCYDSFWDRHPADSILIATSFTQLLARLAASRGQHWYWLQPDFRL